MSIASVPPLWTNAACSLNKCCLRPVFMQGGFGCNILFLDLNWPFDGLAQPSVYHNIRLPRQDGDILLILADSVWTHSKGRIARDRPVHQYAIRICGDLFRLFQQAWSIANTFTGSLVMALSRGEECCYSRAGITVAIVLIPAVTPVSVELVHHLFVPWLVALVESHTAIFDDSS